MKQFDIVALPALCSEQVFGGRYKDLVDTLHMKLQLVINESKADGSKPQQRYRESLSLQRSELVLFHFARS